MRFARQALARSLRGVVIRRRLPRPFDSPIYVSAESQLKYLRPGRAGFNAKLLQAAETVVEAESVVWDLGANVGVFALAAASVARHVVAIEPDPALANLLIRSRAGNAHPERIDIINAAISDGSGLARLQIAAAGRASNALAGFGMPGMKVRDAVYVGTVTLDSLLDVFPAPSLLKIDVEGAEVAVLRGAPRLLREHRPAILIEVWKGHAAELHAMLPRYAFFDSDALPERRVAVEDTFNVLAVPEAL